MFKKLEKSYTGLIGLVLLYLLPALNFMFFPEQFGDLIIRLFGVIWLATAFGYLMDILIRFRESKKKVLRGKLYKNLKQLWFDSGRERWRVTGVYNHPNGDIYIERKSWWTDRDKKFPNLVINDQGSIYISGETHVEITDTLLTTYIMMRLDLFIETKKQITKEAEKALTLLVKNSKENKRNLIENK